MKLFLALLMCFLSAAMSYAKSRDDDPRTVAMAGTELSAKQAADLEAQLSDHPDDLVAHTKLLGYYSDARHTSSEANEAFRRHVLWVVKNRPDAEIAGTPFCVIYGPSDPVGHREAKQLWADQTKAHPKDVTILGHAANFLLLNDSDEAETLLKQAKSFESKNPKWCDELGHLYTLEKNKKNAAKALSQFEQAQSLDTSDNGRFYRLDDLTMAAFDAGEYGKASHHAEELLKAAAKNKGDWNYGNAINHANNTLGRIALRNGDKQKANEYLLKAGKTPGSPQLNSFGPNMSLAKELLEAGERDTVLQYFDLCRRFWDSQGDTLDDWIKQVKAGQVPQFGANLDY